MSFRNSFKRGLGSFMETANLVSLTILGVASYLTSDEGLLWIGLGVEAAYLILAALTASQWFRSASWSAKIASRLTGVIKRHETWLDRFRKNKTHNGEDNFALDQVLLIVTVAGFVVIMFFGFGKHLLTHRWPNLTHAQGWEAGAIAWTGLFLLYYLFKTPRTPNVTVDKIIILALGGLNAWFGWEAWKSVGGKPLQHLKWVMGIAACFLFIDLMISIFHDDPAEKARSRASLFWADVPMVFSFIVLLIYLLVHGDTEAPEVFVAGVVACQLLISNAVFVVMEFGLLQPPVPAIGNDKSQTTGLITQGPTIPSGQHP
jgi:hypothetical protein